MCLQFAADAGNPRRSSSATSRSGGETEREIPVEVPLSQPTLVGLSAGTLGVVLEVDESSLSERRSRGSSGVVASSGLERQADITRAAGIADNGRADLTDPTEDPLAPLSELQLGLALPPKKTLIDAPMALFHLIDVVSSCGGYIII